MKRLLLVCVLGVLMAVACGGDAAPEASAPEPGGGEDSTTESASVEAAGEETPVSEKASPDEEDNEEVADAEAEETELDEGRVYSGIDPETGLEVNPIDIPRGQPFIVRGKIHSMNLTPQTEPEFVVETPDGRNYRFQTQPLSEIFLDDGVSQLAPHAYRIGMEAQATLTLDPSAGPTDLPYSDDFVLISEDEAG